MTLLMTEENRDGTHVTGVVKWFDPTKGFGFVVSDGGGPDILLHANVLRNFGQSSVADSAGIEVIVQVLCHTLGERCNQDAFLAFPPQRRVAARPTALQEQSC